MAAGLTLSLKSYADQENAATGLKVAMMDANGEVGKSFQDINKLAIGLGNQLPGTTADFQNMMQMLVRQGIPAENILGGVGKATAYLAVQLKKTPEAAAEFAAKMQDATGTASEDMMGLFDTTEDLGKVTFRPSITAYVVGDDCFDQRDRLIEALNKPGPGTLVHPTYGELKVCVDGEVRVSTSKSEGRIVRFDLKFVEAGELSYPTSGAATAQTLMSSCSALDDCISDSFSGFSIDGVADFVQNDVIGNASIMLGYVSDAMKVVDSAVSDAARLLQGDISVLLPPPSSGKNFVEQVQKMWRTGKRLYGNASDLVTMIKTLSGVSLGSDLQPRGVWKTDSKTTATATQQRNVVASTLRTTAISEAAYAVTRLPAPTTSAVMQNSAVGQATTPAQSTGWPSVTHPALNNAPAVKNTVDLPTWEELTDIRDTLNTAIDKELSRTTSDALFLALRRVKADLNADINTRLEQSARIIQRTPDEVLPALVLAATWFDNAARDADIIRRNAITHPGFVPVIPLKVPVQ
ncbi:phage tail tape measure protein [Escherichia coli]|nr:phage tail tape measure protein [Escherichia coli]